ncbi:MAG: GGDEF domain-containing protein [Lachnospiraceae bacterium]
MDFKNEIVDFVTNKIGGIIIVDDAEHTIAFADSFVTNRFGADLPGKVAMEALEWLAECPPLGAEVTEWEFIEAGSYYQVHSTVFEKEGKNYALHKVMDISLYMSMNRDMTRYMSFFKKLSGFQAAVMEKLQSTYYELMPMLADFFKSERIYVMFQREDQLDVIQYVAPQKAFESTRIPFCDEIINMKSEESLFGGIISQKAKRIFTIPETGELDHFQLLVNGEVSMQKYAIYLSVGPKTDQASMSEGMIISVVRLFVENSILREQLIYNSEHDSLTGLYNKGKYLSMVEESYPKLDSIGIFNLDVNNLKKMNDTYGHEMGDKLLIKAADSIRKVTNQKVHGYRMGGDEYLMVACNMTEEEVNSIKDRWEKELAHLNTLDDGIDCVVAVGLVYAQKPYDYEALCKEADALMYEDKKRKKKPGEEIR